jgi:DNA-directed RNA polymerase beta' subunit
MAAILKKLGKQGNRGTARNSSKVESKKKSSYRNVTMAEKNQQTVRTYREQNSLPEADITKITFSLFDEESINRVSVCEVKNVNKSYDLSFSTDDPRLGTIENNKLCATCGKSNQDCPGHLGKIELPVSIIHPFYRSFVIMVLQTICFTCGKLLITEKIVRDKGYSYLKGKERLSCIADFCKDMRCTNPKCGPRPIFFPKSSENETRYVWYKIKIGKQERKEYLTVETIKMKLDAISETDSSLLGFKNNHPRKFIVNFIPVIPLCARPYVVREGERSDDYLTVTYCNILNKKIESAQRIEPDQKETVYQDMIDYYRFMIEGMKNSELSFNKGGKKENCKPIIERISKKPGIVRKYLLGKRIDYTGRSVIGPNGTLEFNQIALPLLMKPVTIPVFATKYNLEYLRELGRRGEVSYICPREGNNPGIKLNFNINRHTIQLGDKVGRYTQKGDVVLGNRQPTLHVQSMVGQEVVFQDKGSIGIHLSSTPGLNADFDGDEGNIHFLQTSDAQVEARIIMSAKETIMSNSNSKPQSQLVYNSIVGGYMLSGDDVMFTMDEFRQGVRSTHHMKSDYIKNNMENLFSRAGVSPDEDTIISGKLLCSILFPPNFWYRSDDVYIVNGIMLKGRFTKKHLKESHNTLIQSFVKWHGNETATDFITAANFLFNWYVERSGLSIGIKDCIPEGIKAFNSFKDKEVRELNNKFITLGSEKDQMSEAQLISKKLDYIKDSTNRIEQELVNIMPTNNNLVIMKDSGAKGKDESTMHMVGFKGQVMVGSNLPKKKLSGGRRWLTTFSTNDDTAYATGFSNRSFLDGLEPNAFVAMAQEGRLNNIDRQLKTAKTGYMQRKVIKAQEDLTVGYDGAVYSQTSNIVDFTYGAGFAVNQMVLDSNDDGEKFYSFINTQELNGRINAKNGFKRYNISEEVGNIFVDVLGDKVEVDLSTTNEGEYELGGDEYDDYTQEDEFDEDMYVDDGEGFEFE